MMTLSDLWTQKGCGGIVEGSNHFETISSQTQTEYQSPTGKVLRHSQPNK